MLTAAGLGLDDSGSEPIPDALVGRSAPDSTVVEPSENVTTEEPGFLAKLVHEFEEVPFFLRHSLSTAVGLPDLSLRDLFWTGGRTGSLHPYLRDAIFVSVNRRLKRPVLSRRKSLWEQPLYVLLLRDGNYLVSGCSVEDGTLVLHPFADGSLRPERMRLNVDAEVVGKVTALFRRLR